MLGLVIAMLTCLMSMFQLIYLCAKMMIFYVLLCAKDAQGEQRELPTKHSVSTISSFSANPSREQGAIQPVQ